MTAIPYKTKSGANQFRPECTYEEASEGGGFCLACGNEQSGCEPDGRKLMCESCGARKVYGLEELALMGLLIITSEE